MRKNNKDIFTALHLHEVGFAELLLALYPILSAYSYGGIPLHVALLLVVDIHVLLSNGFRKISCSKELLLFIAFFIFHEVIFIPIIAEQAPSYHVNACISILVGLCSIFLISSNVNLNKLIGSINWIAFICLVGMISQFYVINQTGFVSPIKVPFLPESCAPRLDQICLRPVSFFMEPAAYSEYMIIPLFFAVIEKNWLWTLVLVAGILMSASTTGLLFIFVFGLFFIPVAVKRGYRIGFVVTGLILFISLNYTSWFQNSTDKFVYESGRTNNSVRLSNGIKMLAAMNPQDYIIGVPYINSWDYYCDRGLMVSEVVVYGSDSTGGAIYMASAYEILLKYGIIGMFFYLLVFFVPMKNNKFLIPLIACFIVGMFGTHVVLEGMYPWRLIYVYAFLLYFKR